MIKRYLNKYLKYFVKKDETCQKLLGKQLSWAQRRIEAEDLSEIGYSVFSQWDEDGIIQYLVKKLPIDNKYFIEFGVEDYSESNTRFLMMNNNWGGVVVDGDGKNISSIKNSYYYWKYDLIAVEKFITKKNIDDLLKDKLDELGISKEIGLLSIDIDGVDYWVLSQIKSIDPAIIICEYNSIFGNSIPVTIPHDEDFVRSERHYSNLYFGANLKAFDSLLENRGYVYIGSSLNSINAFFVKKSLADSYLPNLIKDASSNFYHTKVRESRNRSGDLNFKRSRERLKEIKDMPLYNLKTNKLIKVQDLPEY